MSEIVTASQRVRRQRDQLMTQCLGSDLLQRELRGIDQYLSMPSFPVAWLERPYADYCRELAAPKGFPEPATYSWQALETAGWKRPAMVHNLELVCALFHRPLELWLLLDRCLYLVEQSYSIHLGESCLISLPPRNLPILAEPS